jgi:selenide,water dikinase
MRAHVTIDDAVPPEVAVLLQDAQTSGGLLLAVPRPAVPALESELRSQGLPAAVIGEVTAGQTGHVDVAAHPF